MTPQIVFLIIGALSLYSFFLVRRATHVQFGSIIPFLYRVHLPNVMKVLTDEEHEIIHKKVDVFNLRILTCFIAAVLAVGLGAFFIVLVSYGGDPRITGYLMSILFAYLVANYDVTSKATGWIRIVENDLLARIVVKNSEAAGFDSLADYFEAENEKVLKEFFDKWNEVADEFDKVLTEEGFDPDKDYNATDEGLEEDFLIMERSHKKMIAKDLEKEKDPDKSEEK